MNRCITTHPRVWLWIRWILALGCFAVGGVCLLLVALMIYRSGVWAWGIYAERPIPHFLGGLAACLAGFVLVGGIRRSRRQWLELAGRVLLLTFSLALSLGAAELGLRAYYSARQAGNSLDRLKALRREGKPPRVRSSHPLASIIQPSDNMNVVYELQPSLDTQFGRRRLRTNARGMRESREYPEERIPNSVRIIGLGDSGMFGWNQEQDEDTLGVLEAGLNQRTNGILYEVLNMAVPGYNSQLEVETLRAKGLAYKPDIVVVGWCDNDFSLPMFLLQKEDYWRRDISYLYRLLFNRAPRFTEVAPGFTLHDLRDFSKDDVLPELTTGTDVQGVKKAFADLLDLAGKSGFKVLVFGPMNHLACETCKAVGIPFADTRRLIPKGKYPDNYLLFYMHPSRDGHRVLAGYLEEELDRRGWLTPTP